MYKDFQVLCIMYMIRVFHSTLSRYFDIICKCSYSIGLIWIIQYVGAANFLRGSNQIHSRLCFFPQTFPDYGNAFPVGLSLQKFSLYSKILFIYGHAFTHSFQLFSNAVCPAGWKPGKETMKPDVKGSKQYFEKAN